MARQDRGLSVVTDAVDVLIVGSGPNGATFARVIADGEPAARVLLVEAGPAVSAGRHVNTIADRALRAAAQQATQGPTQYPYGLAAAEQRQLGHMTADGSPLAHPGLFLAGTAPDFPAGSMASAVGGMGIHWFGACPRPYGSERIDFIDSGELDDAYDEAEDLLRVGPSGNAEEPTAVHLRDVLGSLFDEGRNPSRRVQPLPMALEKGDGGPVQAAPATVLGALLDDGVKGFELRADTVCRQIAVEGRRAVGAYLERRSDGDVSLVKASAVVVAADSLRTPQLLHLSGLGGPALGHYLNEHPYISATLQDKTVPGGVLEPRFHNVLPPSGVTWVPFVDGSFPFHLQLCQRGPRIDLGLFLPKTRHFENAVEFSSTARDFYGMPAPIVRYSLSKHDHELIEQARLLPQRISAALDAPVVAGPTLLPNGSSLHYQGTVRMGPVDDGRSVCDPTSRVWGTENVYVAGNGVIPTSTACNPTLTSVALAIRGARSLAASLAV